MNKTGKGGFVKGQSGNTGGRKRELPLLERDIEGRKTLKKLYALRDDPATDPKLVATVCVALLPHLIGSPRQSIEIEDKRKPTTTSITRVPDFVAGERGQ